MRTTRSALLSLPGSTAQIQFFELQHSFTDLLFGWHRLQLPAALLLKDEPLDEKLQVIILWSHHSAEGRKNAGKHGRASPPNARMIWGKGPGKTSGVKTWPRVTNTREPLSRTS